jgi:hypothetical protein
VAERSHEIPAAVTARAASGSIWEQVKVWFKDNW